MNWTEGTLYRHNRGRLRKANPARQRQKEYFARARARAAELRAAAENGPPPISFLQQSSSPLSRHSRASNKSGSSAGRRSSRTPSRPGIESGRRRIKTTAAPDDSPLPTISRFFQELSRGADATNPPGTVRDPLPSLAMKRPRLAPENPRLDKASDTGVPGARIRPSHIVGAERRSLRHIRQVHAYPLRRGDVMVQIGNQEKRPGESSSIDRSSGSNPVHKPRVELSRLAQEVPHASWLSRESLSDHDERSEEQCCISSDVEGRIITTSFPPLSQPVAVPAQPIPRSLYLYGAFNSETTDSAVARVGRVISPVPCSQKAENLIWRDWLDEGSSAASSHVAVEGSRESLEYKVSPGVSEMHRPEQDTQQSLPALGGHVLHRTSRSHSEDADQQVSSSDSSEILSHYEELLSRLRRLEQFDAPEASIPSIDHSIEISSEDDNPIQDPKIYGERTITFVNDMSVDKEGNVVTKSAKTQREDNTSLSSVKMHPSECASTSSLAMGPPPTVQQAPAVSASSDPDQAWKTFVFGDEGSDEIGKIAFEEARHEAARMLQPSDSTIPSDGSLASECNSNMATICTLYTHGDDAISEPAGSREPAETSTSLQVTHSSSSSGPDAMPAVNSSDMFDEASSVEVNAGTSIVSRVESKIDNSHDDGLGSEENVESGTSELSIGLPSMTTSMAVVPAQSVAGSSEQGTPGDQFRFVPPKLFVGSRSNLPGAKRRTEASSSVLPAKRRRGRPRKKATDGRADIRALPNYSSDPIEEFEDEERPRNSLFPALELA
ncbi:hypothetical protein MFIFM68171_05261 [Madurella fahalii]|uniref:Uncharacterized protein n=1 Tax=Madurella fahalii TaxID=1157608 RepID=A0ABQ0GBD3_9PEZI